jgi:hypothetical protein
VEDLLGYDLRKRVFFKTRYERQIFMFYHEDFTIVALKNVFIRDDLLVRRKRNNAIIDFAGLGRKVFQCTVSFDHYIKPRALEELLVVAGYKSLR